MRGRSGRGLIWGAIPAFRGTNKIAVTLNIWQTVPWPWLEAMTPWFNYPNIFLYDSSWPRPVYASWRSRLTYAWWNARYRCKKNDFLFLVSKSPTFPCSVCINCCLKQEDRIIRWVTQGGPRGLPSNRTLCGPMTYTAPCGRQHFDYRTKMLPVLRILFSGMSHRIVWYKLSNI